MADPFEMMETDHTGAELTKVLMGLLDKENVPMITEIRNPLALAELKVLAIQAKEANYIKTAKILEDLIDYLNLYNISKDRGRSKEIVEGFREILAHDERTKKRGLLP